MLRERRLSRAVPPDDRDQLAAPDRQLGVGERGTTAGVDVGHALDANERWPRRRRRRGGRRHDRGEAARTQALGGRVHVERRIREPEGREHTRDVRRADTGALAACDVTQDRRRRARGEHLPIREQDDRIRALERGVVVLDQEDAPAFVAYASEHRQDVVAADRIEVGRRLVEDEDARPERQQPRDREPLLFAAGERRRIAALEAREPDRGERPRDPRRHLARIDAHLLEPEDDLLRDVGREELRFEVLEDHADRAGELADAAAGDGFAGEAHVAREVGRREAWDEPRETAGERRLAGARGPHDDRERARGKRQRDAIEGRRRRVRVSARERSRLDRERHRRARPAATSARIGSRPSPTWAAPLPVAGGVHGGIQRPLAIS